MTAAHVYRAFDIQGRLLYIGCTTNPVNRFQCHRSQGSVWLPFAASLTWETHPTVADGYGEESLAIMYERPRFNKQDNPPFNHKPRPPFPDADPSGVSLMELLTGAPGRVETVHDRKRRALRRLQDGAA